MSTPDLKARIIQFGQFQATIFQHIQDTLTTLLTAVASNPSLSTTDQGTLTSVITNLQKSAAQASTELDAILSFANEITSSSNSNSINGITAEESILAEGALAEQEVESQALETCASYLGHLVNQIEAATMIPQDLKQMMMSNASGAQSNTASALTAGNAAQGNLQQLVQVLGKA
ncbi:hypothetical protein EV356DRAFT_530058 [Viridothelium virens]|uniref:Uncharacterized protein n=1 Tax=Viridothelium virens TaxID=1048519 RepID=A0A6A6HIN6_VIRVR|nr:hypothetical protein EV356DRAFT_530058 [Viridothelium virens]